MPFEQVEGDPFAVQTPASGGVSPDFGPGLTRVPVYPGAPTTEPVEGDPFAPSTAGLAKSAGVGVAEGMIGIPGMPGDVQKLVGAVAEKLPQPEQGSLEQQHLEQLKKVGFPTSEYLKSLVEHVTGKFYEPQNQVEKDVQTAGQFVGSAPISPGGIVRKAIQAAVPAAASITAGRFSDQNPYVKALAGLVGGVGAGYFTAPGSVDKLLRSKLPPSLTEAHITDAGKLIEDAQRRGVNLTWPEALSQVSGQPIATDLQRILESHPRTRARMQEFMAPRAGQVEQAGRAEVGNIAPYPTERPMVGPRTGEVMKDFTEEVQKRINKASEPYYKAAEGTLFSPQEWQSIQQIPNFDRMLKAVRASPDAWRIRHLPDNSVGVLDAIKKQFRQKAEAAESAFNPKGPNKAVSSTYEMGESAAKQIGVAKSQPYEQALDIQKAGRDRILEPIMRGPIGQIAKSDWQTDRVINLLFPKGPGAGTEKQVSQAVTLLSKSRPAVAEALVRAHVEDALNNAVARLQGGGNQFSGARLAKDLVGHPQEHANLRAAVEALPNGNARWDSLEKMLEIMQATGQRQAKGSLTAFNAMDLNQMSSKGLAELASKAASPSKWARLASDFYESVSSGRNLDQFARLITDPKSGPVFERLRKIDPNSSAAVDMIGRLLGQITSSTTQLRVNPEKKK